MFCMQLIEQWCLYYQCQQKLCFFKEEVYSLINYGEMYLLTKVTWGKFVHSPGWGHFDNPNAL